MWFLIGFAALIVYFIVAAKLTGRWLAERREDARREESARRRMRINLARQGYDNDVAKKG